MEVASLNTIQIGSQRVPMLGMGTWHMGDGNSQQQDAEVASLQYGLDQGLRVIDTAEMYGEGAAERVVGRAIAGSDRADIYLISKFYPWHATNREIRKALTRSLNRLGTDYLDLYLLHWRGTTPMAETIATLRDLKNEGLIKDYGVSNFDTADLTEACAVPGGQGIVANEVLYNLSERGIEYNLIAKQQRHGMALIGYSPFGSGNGQSIQLPKPVQTIAAAHKLSRQQLLLAWALRSGQVLSIPKTASVAHMQDNIDAATVVFSSDELAVIDQYFPAPQQKEPLATI